jgi:putative ABC transport system substrate-binding protein
MREGRLEALLIMATPQFFGDASVLARLAREARLPTICEWADMARAGCLLGFGPDINDLRRRSANLIARVLRGARPGEIPIEQPTRFSLGVNLGTAQALGVTLPAAVMAQADEVFE